MAVTLAYAIKTVFFIHNPNIKFNVSHRQY